MVSDFLDRLSALKNAGFALHWLHPRSKRPIGEGWADAPVATLDVLRKTHAANNNLGVRLGEPSLLDSGLYLHVLDIDIRIADLADEAWDAVAILFPDLDINTLPCVISGSGGESRHLYFATSQPFRSKKLAVSEGKHRQSDGRWSYDWEIELFGTGKQVALPPSIHPDTRKPYIWLREPAFDDFDPVPAIDSAAIERLAVPREETYEFETREPLEFKPGQLETELALIPLDRIDDRNDWISLGMALHHQFGGSEEGFRLWMETSSRGSKYLVKSSERAELRRWRQFGRNRRKPVTMATVRQWAQEARIAAMVDDFDDLDDDFQTGSKTSETGGNTEDLGDFQDLLDDDLSAFDLTETEKPESDAKKKALEWRSLLAATKDGEGWASNLHNIELIVRNDERLVGLPQLNEFTQETVQRTAPGQRPNRRKNPAKATRQLGGRIWQVDDPLNGEIWSSSRDYAIRSILEAPQTQGGYAIKVSDRDLKAATVLAAWDHSFHPVREYLSGLKWDGTNRIDELFIDYLGAENNAYTRAVGRLLMVAAVARVFEPGCKWDYAVILEGAQGKGKSTFIRYLGKHLFSELEGDFHNGKELVEKMQGSWIMEMPELSGFNRADVRSIKAFISRQVDKVRLAYEARAMEFPRQCVLIGSTNDREYLKDDTGGRRFLPIECRVKSIDNLALLKNVDQMWAEAYAIYREMRDAQPIGDLPLYLSDTAASLEAARLQETRRVESADDALIGRIIAFLDTPVTTSEFDDDDQDAEPRQITCLAEIWVGLGNDLRAYKGVEPQSLGRAMARVPGWRQTGSFHKFPFPFGRQRYYERIESEG